MGYMRFCAVFTVFAFLLTTGLAHAQQALEVFEKEVPHYDGLSAEDFKQQSDNYQKVPFGDETLEYSLRLPKGWEVSNSFGFSLSKDLMTDIGRFTGPVKFNKERSRVRIQAMELDYKTSIEEWFISNIWKSGYSIQGAEVKSPFEIESLHVELDEGQTHIVRARTFLIGTRIIQILYYLPQESWKDEQALQEHVIDSFQLRHRASERTVETLKQNFFDVVTMRYPVSWELEQDPKQSLDRVEAEVINYDALRIPGQKRVVNGRVYIGLFSQFVSKSVEDEMAKHLDFLSARDGIVVQGFDKRRIKDFNMAEDFGEQRIEVYSVLDGRNPNTDTELWVFGSSIGDHNAVFSLITPSKEKHYAQWTMNVQAFKLMLESMHGTGAELF